MSFLNRNTIFFTCDGTYEVAGDDMHILADSKLSLEESHKLTHEIQDDLRRQLNDNADVIVHLEPYKENNNETMKEFE